MRIKLRLYRHLKDANGNTAESYAPAPHRVRNGNIPKSPIGFFATAYEAHDSWFDHVVEVAYCHHRHIERHFDIEPMCHQACIVRRDPCLSNLHAYGASSDVGRYRSVGHFNLQFCRAAHHSTFPGQEPPLQ